MRILIVDDDKTFCQLLTELLEDKGHEVEWTSHGLQGYKMSQRKYYDLFIFGPHAGCAGDGARRRFKRTISWHKNNLGLGICRRAAAERCKKSWHSAFLQAFYHGKLFGLGRENRRSKIPMTPRFKKLFLPSTWARLVALSRCNGATARTHFRPTMKSILRIFLLLTPPERPLASPDSQIPRLVHFLGLRHFGRRARTALLR